MDRENFIKIVQNKSDQSLLYIANKNLIKIY